MSHNITDDFMEPKRPKSLIGATARFLLFFAITIGLYLFTPISWSGWHVAVIIGIVAGLLWAISWRWEAIENRVVAWLLIYLGGMTVWAIIYRKFPSFGALACMYVGYEFILLLFHTKITAWTAPPSQITKRQNKSEMATPRKPSDQF
jgi:hypothetical protein